MTPSTALWFHDLGIHVFPTDDKVPAVPKGTSQFDYRCTRELVASFKEYGVPLGLLAVADSDSRAAEAWNAAHLPETPFKVTTGPYHDKSQGRGRHRYYRLVSDPPHFIHRDGNTTEFKHRGQYVVGPGSTRPDGVTYVADAWSWNIHDVPFFPRDFFFDDRPYDQRGSGTGQPLVLPKQIFKQERHEVLHRLMRSMAAHGVPLDGASRAARIVNQVRCSPPLTDRELNDDFLRRAHQQKDRKDFVRAPKAGWHLCGVLFELGLPADAVLIAAKSTDPTFDPESFS